MEDRDRVVLVTYQAATNKFHSRDETGRNLSGHLSDFARFAASAFPDKARILSVDSRGERVLAVARHVPRFGVRFFDRLFESSKKPSPFDGLEAFDVVADPDDWEDGEVLVADLPPAPGLSLVGAEPEPEPEPEAGDAGGEDPLR